MMTTTITQEEFKALVANDVRKETTPEQQAQLCSDYDSWLNELNIMLNDVQIQLSHWKARNREKKAELQPNWNAETWTTFRLEQDRWRTNALRFKASVEATIREVKALKKKYNESLLKAS